MQIGNILVGYRTQATAYEVDDYPWGFRLRTKIHYWIETKKGKGDRFCSYTIDPRSGRACKPKCSTYGTFMYMYIDEKGHVQHGIIDSYDREQFEARFEFLLEKIGEEFVSDEQKLNIRVNHYQHVYGNAPYELVKYSEDSKPVFKKWVQDTLKHIKTCDFKLLVSYPPKPERDNPTGEVQFTTTQYTSQ